MPLSRGQECSKHNAYITIIVSILPLWIILTTLIVFILLSFHRNLRATKIYDECTKLTAQYTYYIELRTGDTTSSFSRRKTTITIDMFDDNQTTLARIAIPCHVIFGRKDMPIGVIDDDRYSDLRVTRLWLYRATRLKRATTIRVTHSCTEPDARIMVYGVEIRCNDRDRNRLFFPIMSYISAYGATNKPNTCFDIEPAATISIIGGPHSDNSAMSIHLSWVDYATLGYLLMALIYYLTSFQIASEAFIKLGPSIYNGAATGIIAYAIVFCFGLFLRYVIKYYYHFSLGLGISAWIYYSFSIVVVVLSTTVWLWTTVNAYKEMCSHEYSYWVLSLVVSAVVSAVFVIIQALIHWLVQSICPRSTEQFMIPEEISGGSADNSKSKAYRPFVSMKQQQQQQQHHHQLTQLPMQQSWHGVPPAMPMPMMISPMNQGGYTQGQGYPPNNQSLVMGTLPSYKTLQTNYDPQPVMGLQQPVPQHQQQQTYNQQTTTNLTGIKATKKIGSSESTGSNYYQQLMKNKGGVKSISQYGELMRQKKAAKANAGKQ